MAGNERDVVQYLVNRKNNVDYKLRHLGQVISLQSPSSSGLIEIDKYNIDDVVTESSSKKADIYINSRGISIKQSGSSVLYNRLQRKNVLGFLEKLKIETPEVYLKKLDEAVNIFHHNDLSKRDRDWQDFFKESDFKSILQYLMMQGSPNLKDSIYPASFLLESPKRITSFKDIHVYTFDEYFERYKHKITFGLRRSWIGQKSKSEHNRAVTLARQRNNSLWVYSNVAGVPRKGWNDEIPETERKTVYYISLMKKT